MTNKEISSKFTLLGKLLEVHDENAFKSRSYANAAFQIKRLEKPLAEMSSEEIGAVKGIGKAIQDKIDQLLSTGHMKTLDRYLEQTPEGVIEMLRIPGLGGRKIGIIWRELEVYSPGELLYACYENRLALLKGFGSKTQAKVIESIEFMQAHAGLYHYASIEAAGDALLEVIRGRCDRAELTGAHRRRCITLEGIEILATGGAASEASALLAALVLEGVLIAGRNTDSSRAVGQTENGIPVYLSTCPSEEFDKTWFRQTASKAHLALLPDNLNLDAGDEKAIYGSAGLSWIPPEMREGLQEVKLAAEGPIPDLLQESDIKGAVHNHSTWSDGSATLEAMAKACIERGWEYLIITDHSKTAVYAGGLTAEQVLEQRAEVDRLNQELAPFRIFQGIESDILGDGSLDYDKDILEQFDAIVASVHSAFSREEDKATERLVAAVANPYTTILGHPTGRLLLSREGYPVNHPALIEACAEHDTILELNANPYRLDLDWRWIPEAVAKGVPISINPDAHNVEGLDHVRFGIWAARKAGLTAAQTWNTKSLEEMEAELKRRQSALQEG